jgi:hypothetical protein
LLVAGMFCSNALLFMSCLICRVAHEVCDLRDEEVSPSVRGRIALPHVSYNVKNHDADDLDRTKTSRLVRMLARLVLSLVRSIR